MPASASSESGIPELRSPLSTSSDSWEHRARERGGGGGVRGVSINTGLRTSRRDIDTET